MFHLCWLKEHNWLAYSTSQDGAYSKLYTLFGSKAGDKMHPSLISITFWKTAKQKFKDHESKSLVHETASLKADNFVKVMNSKVKPIGEQL